MDNLINELRVKAWPFTLGHAQCRRRRTDFFRVEMYRWQAFTMDNGGKNFGGIFTEGGEDIFLGEK